jgi:hypothetical protein
MSKGGEPHIQPERYAPFFLTIIAKKSSKEKLEKYKIIVYTQNNDVLRSKLWETRKFIWITVHTTDRLMTNLS